MGRFFNIVLLTAMLIGVAVTYDMKHKAELAADRVAKLQADIVKEKESIQVLKAQWSMLDQPERLQSVVKRYTSYFELAPFAPTQIATIDEIPQKPVDVVSAPREKVAASRTTRTASAE